MGRVFSLDLSKENLPFVQEVMDSVMSEWERDAKELSESLEIPVSLAFDILYIRERSWGSQNLEDRVLRCFRSTGNLDYRVGAGETEEVLVSLGF